MKKAIFLISFSSIFLMAYSQDMGDGTGTMDSIEVTQFIQQMRPIIQAEEFNTIFESGFLPSPEVSGVNQHSPTPISLYTGTPHISIPIYNIEVGDYKLPVSLHYNAGGIRVAQEASRIGLGWNLIAGGTIMRVVRDLDDTHYNLVRQIHHPFYSEHHNEYPGGPDKEADIFFYNFNTYSGQFFWIRDSISWISRIDYMDEAVDTFLLSKPQDALNISYNHGNNSFSVKTPDNIIYRFSEYDTKQKYWQIGSSDGKVERIGNSIVLDTLNAPMMSSCLNSSFQPEFCDSFNVISTWYLTDIIMPTGDSIKLEYNIYNNAYRSPVYKKQVFIDALDRKVEYDVSHHKIYENGTKYYKNDFEPKFEETQIIEGFKRYPEIKRIKWKNGSLKFVTGNQARQDLRSYNTTSCLYPLERIELRNTQEELIRSWILHNSYFIGHPSNKEGMIDYLCKRLRLDSISVQGLDDNIYRYNMLYDTSDCLPPKNTNYFDKWGFYTGVMTDNDECVFDVEGSLGLYSFNNNTSNLNWITLCEKVRQIPEPTLSAKTWSLKQMTNPTGLTIEYFYDNNSTFNYSLNTEETSGGIRLSKIKEGDQEKFFDYAKYIGPNKLRRTSGKLLWKSPLAIQKGRIYIPSIGEPILDMRYNVFFSPSSNYGVNPFTQNMIGYDEVYIRHGSNETNSFEKIIFHNDIEFDLNELYSQSSSIYIPRPLNGKIINYQAYADSVEITHEDYNYLQIPTDTVEAKNYIFYNYFAPIVSKTIKKFGTTATNNFQKQKKIFTYNQNYLIDSVSDSIYGYSARRHEFKYSYEKPNYLNGSLVANGLNRLILEESFSNGQQLTEKRFYTFLHKPYPALNKTFVFFTGNEEIPQFSDTGIYPSLPEGEIVSYTERGRPLHVKSRGGRNTTILWSYNHQYPVAHITGSTPDEISSQGIDIDELACKSSISEQDWNALNNLRAVMTNAFVETTFYEPLVGVTRKIDSAGYETHYYYDGLGRLTEVTEIKNGTELTLKKYEYKLASGND